MTRGRALGETAAVYGMMGILKEDGRQLPSVHGLRGSQCPPITARRTWKEETNFHFRRTKGIPCTYRFSGVGVSSVPCDLALCQEA